MIIELGKFPEGYGVWSFLLGMITRTLLSATTVVCSVSFCGEYTLTFWTISETLFSTNETHAAVHISILSFKLLYASLLT